MEPRHVEEIQDLERDDAESVQSSDTEVSPTDEQYQKAIDVLRQQIYEFKRSLYEQTVNKDSSHDAADMGAMMTFHAIFLHCISYWISLLDSSLVPEPQFPSSANTQTFKTLTRAIQKVAQISPDAQVHLYQLLFQFGQQHPFELGDQELE